MTDKMNVWNALKTTDPKYTKKVEFGRKFTSINSQWQLQRMTEQFGPIGQGWGYSVDHAVERITDDYVLAVADVAIWWRTDDKVAQYGPVRGMSPIVEKTNAGKIIFDDDAGKKAMTDALTKGLSHLGLSADVFLGLFDDNKYVQKVAQQFAAGNGQTESPKALESVDAADQHLVQGDGRSTYQVAHADKSSGRLAAELWASQILGMFKLPGFDVMAYRDWQREPCALKSAKTNAQKLNEMREKHPDLTDKIDEAAADLRVAAA